MKSSIRVLSDKKISYLPGETVSIDLPRDKWIQKIMGRLVVNYDTGGAGSVAEDGVLNLIKQMKITADGDDARFGMALKRLRPTNCLDMGAPFELLDVTDINAAGKTAVATFEIAFKHYPRVDDDVSALLPAKYFGSLQYSVTFPPETVGVALEVGADQTINTAVLTLTLKEYELSASEENQLYGRMTTSNPIRFERNLAIYRNEETKTIDGAYADYGFSVELPPGCFLLRSLIFANDAGARSDSIVTGIKLRDAQELKDLKSEDWEALQARDKQEYGLALPLEAASNRTLVGFGSFDYKEIQGVDMRGRKKGDVVLGFTTTTPTPISNLIMIHEKVA